MSHTSSKSSKSFKLSNRIDSKNSRNIYGFSGSIKGPIQMDGPVAAPIFTRRKFSRVGRQTENYTPEVKLNEQSTSFDASNFNGTEYGDTRLIISYKGKPADTLIKGSRHDDTITGGDGSNGIFGNDGEDTITGGGDSDAIYGMDQSDFIYGEAGDDKLSGGKDDDIIDGGAGKDRFYIQTTQELNGTDRLINFSTSQSDNLFFNFGEEGGLASQASLRGKGTNYERLATGARIGDNTGFVIGNSNIASPSAVEAYAKSLQGIQSGDKIYLLGSTNVFGIGEATLYAVEYSDSGTGEVGCSSQALANLGNLESALFYYPQLPQFTRVL